MPCSEAESGADYRANKDHENFKAALLSRDHVTGKGSYQPHDQDPGTGESGDHSSASDSTEGEK